MTGKTWRVAAGMAVAAALWAAPVRAQTDFSGEWANANDEDREDRIPGPDLGDYTGLPLNDAARQKAEAWDASVLALPERQSQPHPAQYFMHGPGPGGRIEQVLDPVSGDLLAYTFKGTFGRADRTIWLDGRPHPSAYAEHTWAGFSTGEWDGDTLVITTTHIKYGVVRRNGVPASPEAVVTERWTRYGDYLLIVEHVDDPVYLTEPLVRSNLLELDPGRQTGRIVPFESVDEILTRSTGNVPHYPLGVRHPEFAERVGLPFEATLGGAETLYPEYQLRLEALTREMEAAGR